MVATIVKSWKDANNGYLSVVVAEGGALGNIEYSASTPLLDAAGNPKSVAQVKSDIVAALKAKRDAQLNGNIDLGLTGTVTL